MNIDLLINNFLINFYVLHFLLMINDVKFLKVFFLKLETGKAGVIHKENEKLKKELKKLEEENNLLRIKFEIMLDMVRFFNLIIDN